MNNNGGFPPIQYIDNKKTQNKDKNVIKERFFAITPTKNLDIRHILSTNAIHKKMIDINKTDIETIESL